MYPNRRKMYSNRRKIEQCRIKIYYLRRKFFPPQIADSEPQKNRKSAAFKILAAVSHIARKIGFSSRKYTVSLASILQLLVP